MASKIADEIGNLTVMELAKLVEELQETYGVSAAVMPAPAAAAAVPPGEAASAAEEKTEFKVTLKDAGPEKIKAIKALRSVTSKSLKEAKEIVESAGDTCVIAEAAPKEEAQKMKEALEAAGATVVLS